MLPLAHVIAAPASPRPVRVEYELNVMEASAIMLPSIVLLSPIVALEPMDQYTLPGAPLFTIRTTESGKLVNVEAVIKVNSELWSFFPSNVSVRPALRRKAPEEVQYTPGVSIARPIRRHRPCIRLRE